MGKSTGLLWQISVLYLKRFSSYKRLNFRKLLRFFLHLPLSGQTVAKGQRSEKKEELSQDCDVKINLNEKSKRR